MDQYYIKIENWEKIYALLKARQDVRAKSAEKTMAFEEVSYFIMRTGASRITNTRLK